MPVHRLRWSKGPASKVTNFQAPESPELDRPHMLTNLIFNLSTDSMMISITVMVPGLLCEGCDIVVDMISKQRV